MHSPLRTDLGDNPRSNTQDRRELFQTLAGREHLYAVAGHTHTTEHHYFAEEDGFPGPGALPARTRPVAARVCPGRAAGGYS